MTSCAEGSAATVLSCEVVPPRALLSLARLACLAAAVRSPEKDATCPAWISLATRERSMTGSLSVHCCSCTSLTGVADGL